MQPGMSVSFVARQAGVSPSQLFAWKRRMLEGGMPPQASRSICRNCLMVSLLFAGITLFSFDKE